MGTILNPYRYAPVSADTWTANNATLSPYDGNLIGYWSFDNVLTDTVGNGDLTDGATMGYAAGIHNDDGVFDGSTDYAYCPHATYDYAAVLKTGIFSVSLWFKTAASSSQIALLDTASASYGNPFSLWQRNDNNYINARLFAAAGQVANCVSAAAYNNDARHHLFVIADGSNLKQYIDGNLDGSGAMSGTIADSNPNMFIGAFTDQSGKYTGMIGEIAIWNTNLSETEVDAVYNTGSGAFCQG